MKFQDLIKYRSDNPKTIINTLELEISTNLRDKEMVLWCGKCNKKIEFYREDYCLVPEYEPGFAGAIRHRSDGLIMTFACHNEQISFHFNTERELVSVLMKERED